MHLLLHLHALSCLHLHVVFHVLLAAQLHQTLLWRVEMLDLLLLLPFPFPLPTPPLSLPAFSRPRQGVSESLASDVDELPQSFPAVGPPVQ